MLARSSLRTGIAIAALSALSFGVSAPAVARSSAGVGPFTSAALLYAGALCSSWAISGFGLRAPLGLLRRHGGRLLLIASLGAALGPAAFVWGLQKSGATSGSLLLNFEAVFTALFAWYWFAEPVGGRFGAALAAMAAGGAVLAIDGARKTEVHPLGLLAIVCATLCWAIDNTLTRAVSEEPPFAVVAVKSALGAIMALSLAFGLAEPAPRSALQYLFLLAIGAVGYGLSLRLYLEAQTRIGAARTASVFALAPFVGAFVAWLFGDRALGWGGALSVPCFALGAYLHLTERHQHRHRHEALEHEHAHRHDDGHHLHSHVPPVLGQHTHSHRHDPLEHSHDHAPDLHHRHAHDDPDSPPHSHSPSPSPSHRHKDGHEH